MCLFAAFSLNVRPQCGHGTKLGSGALCRGVVRVRSIELHDCGKVMPAHTCWPLVAIHSDHGPL